MPIIHPAPQPAEAEAPRDAYRCGDACNQARSCPGDTNTTEEGHDMSHEGTGNHPMAY